jgi:formiminotetrahydrofolate cyclodeaminase
MEGRLMGLQTSQLLKEFGAGNAKPGSGSAAALQALIATQLIHTVIDLTTCPEKRDRYPAVQEQFLRIDGEITDRIYPRLVHLFEEDSILFGQTVDYRKLRDNASDPSERKKYDDLSKAGLIPAINIPLEITRLSFELGEFASYVFNNGFKAALGDSNVALNAAASAIAGYLSIIELNLHSLPLWYP